MPINGFTRGQFGFQKTGGLSEGEKKDFDEVIDFNGEPTSGDFSDGAVMLRDSNTGALYIVEDGKVVKLPTEHIKIINSLGAGPQFSDFDEEHVLVFDTHSYRLYTTFQNEIKEIGVERYQEMSHDPVLSDFDKDIRFIKNTNNEITYFRNELGEVEALGSLRKSMVDSAANLATLDDREYTIRKVRDTDNEYVYYPAPATPQQLSDSRNIQTPNGIWVIQSRLEEPYSYCRYKWGDSEMDNETNTAKASMTAVIDIGNKITWDNTFQGITLAAGGFYMVDVGLTWKPGKNGSATVINVEVHDIAGGGGIIDEDKLELGYEWGETQRRSSTTNILVDATAGERKIVIHKTHNRYDGKSRGYLQITELPKFKEL